MAEKRTKSANQEGLLEDLMVIKPLGAGQEVGRSCHIISYKKKNIMLDCGIHPGKTGMASLPFFDYCNPKEIDLLIISHFHLDHIASLPYFMEKTNFDGEVYMTHPTKMIFKSLLADFVKISHMAADEMLFNETDLENCLAKIKTMNYHQTIEHNGIKFTPYNAGHVLGAAMIELQIAGVRILYTGDYSREDDRHLMAAEIPPNKPDVLIIEATYGTANHEPKEEREKRFTEAVDEVITRNGRCLIPVLALGRAQELLLILDEYWEENPRLQEVPIYYASALATQCMSVYQTYIHMMNQKIQEQFNMSQRNPFFFKHIKNLNLKSFDDSGPCVVMASPGMLQKGTSRDLFDKWCSNKMNGCIICGYCVEGTLAKRLITSHVQEVETIDGQTKKVAIEIKDISFSAHADYAQTKEFVDAILPPHIILVHGEASNMLRLKRALEQSYETREDVDTTIYNPGNTEGVELYFRGEKKAKVVGTLAQFEPTDGTTASGILVKQKFNYLLVDSDDLEEYSGLPVTPVNQKQLLEYHFPFSVLHTYLEAMFTELTYAPSEHDTNATITVFDTVIITAEENLILSIEWPSNPVNDMIADSIISTILEIELNPATAKMVGSRCNHKHPDHEHKAALLEADTTNKINQEHSITGLNGEDDDNEFIDHRENVIRFMNTLVGYFRRQYEDVQFLKTNLKICKAEDEKSGKIVDITNEENEKLKPKEEEEEETGEKVHQIQINTGTSTATITMESMTIDSEDPALKNQIKSIINYVNTRINVM